MHDDRVLLCRVSPFGNLRIKGYLLLPEAYRSLSRPSSAPDAKAVPLRSLYLDLFEIFWFSFSLNYAGNHRFFISQNCNCYPLLLQKCSTIKISQLSSRSSLKDLSVALLFITFNTLFSFQGAMFRSLLKPDVNVQSLERFHLFSKASRLLLSGGDSRDRTGDLLLARQALSQLSYIPISSL